MKPDRQKTKVVFIIDKEQNHEFIENNIFAFFPELIENEGKSMFLSYAHIGQHSSASIDYAKECKQANESEYIELKKELESIGYNLEVIDSF